ncbi:MAG: DUF4062 domain-containing protein, partial [Methylotetracoccus sp.]|nr:DUF4062 domain-containing protein [Methylotetracoccus sp.]
MGAKREGLLSRVWRALFGRKPDSVVDESSASADPGSPRVAPELIMTQEASSPAHIPTEHAVPSSAGRDRAVRVFVSSTFRDRVEDRNALMAQVWPALRKLCREWSVEFVEVDLRWGITEEMSQRAETLRHCPAEIKRCRPYFIGLLGERNGWVPGPDSYSEALLQEERWLEQEIARHSVTELEMLHGVLNDPAMAGRAFFYFRDPAYAESKGTADYQPEDEA